MQIVLSHAESHLVMLENDWPSPIGFPAFAFHLAAETFKMSPQS